MTTEKIKKWIEKAKSAPSGGNAQPWSVAFESTPGQVAFRLKIDESYRKKKSPMDVKGSAAALALGSFAFNLEVAAAHDGFKLQKTTYIEGSDLWSSSAILSFVESSEVLPEVDLQALENRFTNRLAFESKPIPEKLRNKIKQTIESSENVNIFEFHENKMAFAKELMRLEKIRWQNPFLLGGFLKEISFGRKDKSRGDKIPLSQLGIPLQDQVLLRVLVYIPPIRYMFRMGFHKIPVYQGVVKPVKYCDRVFFLQAKHHDFKNCFQFGKEFQKIWIYVNQEKVSFQPLAASFIALNYWLDPENNFYTKKQRLEIKSVTESIRSKFSLDLSQLAIGFRVGHTDGEFGRAPRKEVNLQEEPGLLERYIHSEV